MHSHGWEPLESVTLTSPLGEPPRGPAPWAHNLPRDRNLDVKRQRSRWRSLAVAVCAAALPTLLVLSGALLLWNSRDIKAVAVFEVGGFTALVTVLTGTMLDRILKFRNDYVSTSFAGLGGGVLLGAFFGGFIAAVAVFAYAVVRALLHRSHPGYASFVEAGIAGGFLGAFLGGPTGLTVSFFTWLRTANPND